MGHPRLRLWPGGSAVEKLRRDNDCTTSCPTRGDLDGLTLSGGDVVALLLTEVRQVTEITVEECNLYKMCATSQAPVASRQRQSPLRYLTLLVFLEVLVRVV